MDTIAQVAVAMRAILTTTANTLARTSGFVQRTSKLTGAGFVQAWVFACMASPMPTWEDVSQSAATIGIAITAQGLEDRCGEAAATLLKEVVQASIQQVIAAEPVAIPLLNRFPSVFIEDSSTIVLPPVLAATWRGCGGATAHGNAALKVQVRLDLCCGTLRGPALQDGRAAEQRSPLHDEPLVAKALYLADLGYWSLARFGRIASAGAFWLSRYQPQTALFTADGQRWDDVRRLVEAQGTAQVDLPVRVGVDARVPARLLGVRLPPAVAEARRQRIIAEARAAGKPVSGDLLQLAAWTLFVTNAPCDLLSLREALVIGRARWQIELLFKLWKSHGHVDESRGAQPWRVLCEVYAKLLAVLISHWVMLTELWAYPDRSLVKAAHLIQKHAFHLASSLWSQRALEDALNVIRDGLRACCRMNARQKHPNTYQVLKNPELSYVA
jgi:hypothetical protein